MPVSRSYIEQISHNNEMKKMNETFRPPFLFSFVFVPFGTDFGSDFGHLGLWALGPLGTWALVKNSLECPE